ncbi:MAG: PqqD family peptide modification chaperone [Desulfuromonadales bacterium]|nr:PqqD family peptide modification chaperone [Desulfuromonadales bacterium]
MNYQPCITFYPFDEGAALHQEGSHRLWVLNHSSAVLWCLHEEYGTGEQLISAYAEHFSLTMEQAQADVQSALTEFARDGLLSDTEASPRVTSHKSPVTVLDPPVSGPRSPASDSLTWNKSYSLAGVTWQISASEAVAAEAWCSCFRHLEINAASTDLGYQLTAEASGWTLSGSGERIEGLADNEVLPWLLTLLFAELCARQPQKLLLHAAVARRDGRLLMLPGESTFGKSTLAAALATHGWTLYSDELAPLDTSTLQVAPFTLPVGIKSRSLLALKSCYPQLESHPAHRRADGQIVRYLGTPQIALADPTTDQVPVATLIFPRYQPDKPTQLHRLTPLEALERLTQTGSSERPLRPADVDALLTLAGQRPCWRLDYSDLDEAVEVVGSVTSDQSPAL